MTSKLGDDTKGPTETLRCENTQRLLSSRKVSAVMPCLNEEETLGICVEKALRCFHEIGVDGEVVVADNGSTDRSVEIARKLGARIITQPIKGYGAALMAGIQAAKGDIAMG